MTQSSEQLSNLRQELELVIREEHLDIDRVLELSSALARLDPEYVRFSSDGALIDRLGRELVARQETAVSELVKNAYDADATKLTAVFQDAESETGGELTITDNGNGMTRAELANGFMRLASTEKISAPVSPLFRRTRAGRKGIGRFSAQRLGHELIVTTQTREATRALRLHIDWRRFLPGTELSRVASRIDDVPKEQSHGTTLRIIGLKERWSTGQIGRVFRYVEDLLDPFPRVGEQPPGAADSTADPGFKAVFYSQAGESEPQLVASEERTILDNALATIDAGVDQHGNAWAHVRSSRLGVDEMGALRLDSETPHTVFSELRNVTLRAHYFIYESSLLPPQAKNRFQRLGQEQGGFKLYRNGFRVLPYGERRNDWLGLDEESRRRKVLPAIANSNWFGVIAVNDPSDEIFLEVSSREGLEQNLAMQELTDFARAAAVKCATSVAEARGKKTTAGKKSQTTRSENVSSADLRRDAETLKKRADDSGEGGATGPAAEEIEHIADHLLAAASQLTEQAQELEMLRVLSSLGLLVATFTHESRTRVMFIRDQLALLMDDGTASDEVISRISQLREATSDLRSYLGYFDSAITEVLRRELTNQDVSTLLHEFARTFSSVAERADVRIETDIEEGLECAPMVSSEWSSILTNLFTNSVKAIKRAQQPNGIILISAKRDGDQIVVDFSDNGDGIDECNRERVFDAFFTLSVSTGEEDLAGMGLGLKIVRDIVTSRMGEVEVIDALPGFRTSIRLTVPVAPVPVET